jgi:hypothetical protein
MRRFSLLAFLGGGLFVSSAFGAAPKLHESLAKAPANQWVEVQSDDAGGRFASAIVYAPSINGLVWWGPRVHSKKIRTYETEHFDLATAQWIEAFPPGREAWKAKPKQWGDWSMTGSPKFYERDGVKLPRPIMSYWQTAWDTHRGRLVYYVGGITFTYDPAKRAWTRRKTAAVGPPLGLKGSAMVAVPEQKKLVLFGGFGVENEEGRPRTWVFDCEKDAWVRPTFGSETINTLRTGLADLGGRVRRLRRAAQDLEKLPPDARQAPAATLAKRVAGLAGELEGQVTAIRAARGEAAPGAPALDAAHAAGSRASEALGWASKFLENGKERGAAEALETAEDFLVYDAADALRVEPPPRGNAPMAYDSKNRKVVVFGGDHLDYEHADTWVLDVTENRWERRDPKVSPPPQNAHGLCYLEKSGRVFLAGREGNWTYDVAKNVWTPVAGRTPKCHFFTVASAPGTDLVIGCAAWQWNHNRKTYVYRLEPQSATAKHKAFAAEPRRGPAPKTQRYSRKWFDDVPPADPAKFAAFLKAIPDNTWATVKVPKKLKARTWSSCTFDADRREIIYWGGGHSGNTNSNVDHFSMDTGRWSTNYDPMWKPWPFGAKAACPNGRTYQNEPWTMHARKTYAWDPVSGLVAMAHVGGGGYHRRRTAAGVRTSRYTYLYHPAWGEWVDVIETPFRCGYHGAAVTTPKGVMLLDAGQLWRLDVKARQWTKVGARERLPSGEYFSMAYDAKRRRLIYLAAERNKGPAMYHFDLATNQWTKAAPKGDGCYSRDAAYVPGQDAVFAHAGSGTFKVYLCDEDRWIDAPAIEGARRGHSEQALTLDPATELILFIDARQFCGPFDLKAFRLNVKTLKREL